MARATLKFSEWLCRWGRTRGTLLAKQRMGRSEVSEPRSAPTVGQVVLGKRLQDLRERAGLKREEAAQVLRVAPATIRRMETAEVAPQDPLCPAAAEGLRHRRRRGRGLRRAGRGGQQARLVAAVPRRPARLVQHVRQPGGRREPASACTNRTSSPDCCRPRTTRASVMRTGAVGQTRPEDIERHVALRMERQALLTTRGRAPALGRHGRDRPAPARRRRPRSCAPRSTGCSRPPSCPM